ncbi:lipid A deacylase LpxR family protein [Mucisphaera sp.]|uniref:lipid A deacylase LpxR family protein n=1 Tax=Mucisphaera sp. TaxID=2913024 RepID=UPI003D0E42F8
MLRTLLLAVVWTCCFAGVSFGQAEVVDTGIGAEEEEAGWGVAEDRFWITLFVENDSTPLRLIDRTDRQYTSGLQVLLAHQPAWAEAVAGWLPSLDGLDRPAVTAAGYVLGQKIYTPDDLDVSGLQVNDRRYAGHSYLGGFVQRADERTLDHLQVDLGILGPSSGGELVQQNWHDVIAIQEPQGWDGQLQDEPTLQVRFRKKWRYRVSQPDAWLQHELIPRAELEVGTLRRHALVDVLWRFSLEDLPNDFGPSQLDDPGAPLLGLPALRASSPVGLEDRWSIYGYLRGGVMLVEHDTLIEGSDLRDTDTGLDLVPVVGRFQAGLEASYRLDESTISLGYYQTFLTDEFEQQGRSHRYGGVALRWMLPF